MRRSSSPSLFMATGETEESSGGALHVMTTKTNKQIVFDDKSGRFFETSLEPDVGSAYATAPVNPTVTMYSDIANARGFANDEMVPTEILFKRASTTTTDSEASEATTRSKDDSVPHVVDASRGIENDNDVEELPELISALEAAAAASPQPELVSPEPTLRPKSIVEQCYAAWNQRDMSAMAACFDDTGFTYQDSQYLGSITSKSALMQHFQNQQKLLPPNAKVVVDNIAVDGNNNIAAQWHVESSSSISTKVRLTRGCSFYKTNPETGLISDGFRVSEMVVKPTKQIADLVVSSASGVLASPRTFSSSRQESVASPSASASIIEEYFHAWNQRDMEAALACFTDDCVYQTEDPLFVDTLVGKEALRGHLEKNAAALPSSCQIILDSTAVDKINGNIGTTWHLEVNNIAIPNLRGCSMYTTDPETGLLKSGFDVTESPVKIPRQMLSPTSLLSLPARLLFGQS